MHQRRAHFHTLFMLGNATAGEYQPSLRIGIMVRILA